MNHHGKKEQYLYEFLTPRNNFDTGNLSKTVKTTQKWLRNTTKRPNYHLGNCLIDENPKTNLKGKHIHKTGITHIKKFTQQSLYNN